MRLQEHSLPESLPQLLLTPHPPSKLDPCRNSQISQSKRRVMRVFDSFNRARAKFGWEKMFGNKRAVCTQRIKRVRYVLELEMGWVSLISPTRGGYVELQSCQRGSCRSRACSRTCEYPVGLQSLFVRLGLCLFACLGFLNTHFFLCLFSFFEQSILKAFSLEWTISIQLPRLKSESCILIKVQAAFDSRLLNRLILRDIVCEYSHTGGILRYNRRSYISEFK